MIVITTTTTTTTTTNQTTTTTTNNNNNHSSNNNNKRPAVLPMHGQKCTSQVIGRQYRVLKHRKNERINPKP